MNKLLSNFFFKKLLIKYKGKIIVKEKENWIMAKGLLTFVKSIFKKAPQNIETISTTLTSLGTVVKKTINATTKTKSLQHIYQPGSHMAELGVKSTRLNTSLNVDNMAMHGNKPYYSFSSLNVELNNGRRLSFMTPEAARDFFSTASKYKGYMKP